MFNLQYWAETPAGQDLIEMGVERGLEQGVERGSLLHAQRTIRLFLTSRYPDTVAALSEERMKTAEQADDLLARLYAAQTTEEVLELISSRQ